eukprot:4586334-Pleurochrysis_carterae.AAC.1
MGAAASGAAARRGAGARRAPHRAALHTGVHRRLRGRLNRRRGAAACVRGGGAHRPLAHGGRRGHARAEQHARARARAAR